MIDLAITDALLVNEATEVRCDIGISGGQIAALTSPGDLVRAHRIIDAGGRRVIPGLIDTHVHLGNADQEFEADVASESRAAATGGVTTMAVYAFASNLVRPDPDELPEYHQLLPGYVAAANRHSLVDVMFHVGIVHPKYLARIPELYDQFGIRSFKAFMTNKHPKVGLELERRTRGLTDGELLEFFAAVGTLPGGVAMVHAENSELIDHYDGQLRPTGRQDIGAWDERSPAFGELGAIRHVIDLASHTRLERLMIVHLGIGSGSEFLTRKRWGGVGLTIETCPHYLVFDKDQQLGVAAKANPPLRTRENVNEAWKRLDDGTFDLVGSDQLSYSRATKGNDLWLSPPGITGGMPMILPALLTDGVGAGRLSHRRLVAVTSANAARTFGLYPRKGCIAVGSDADLVVLDEENQVEVSPARLNTYADYTPYDGYCAAGWAALTVAGGRVVYEAGDVIDDLGGRVISGKRPSGSAAANDPTG